MLVCMLLSDSTEQIGTNLWEYRTVVISWRHSLVRGDGLKSLNFMDLCLSQQTHAFQPPRCPALYSASKWRGFRCHQRCSKAPSWRPAKPREDPEGPRFIFVSCVRWNRGVYGARCHSAIMHTHAQTHSNVRSVVLGWQMIRDTEYSWQ